MKRLIHICATLWLCLLCSFAWAGERVTVFAAASLKGALDEVVAEWSEQSGHSVDISYAGSSVLARQILQGAPADLFISANPDWMDVVEKRGLLMAGTRQDLLGNRLVLIGAKPEKTDWVDLADDLGDRPFAMALTNAVPAGIYGKAALISLGVWDDLAGQVAQTDNVRTALALVALQEAPFGIVYATDAQAEPRVHVLNFVPQDSHPDIRYPVAILRHSLAIEALLAFLSQEETMSVFQQHGFIPLRAQ